MSDVRFLIRNNKSKNSVSIIYDISISRKFRLRGATKSKILPKYWDSNNQRVRNIAEISNIKDSINKKLSDFKAFVLDKINDYKLSSDEELVLLLKNDIGVYFGKIVIKKEVILTFYPAIEKFIQQSKGRIIERTGKPISNCTIKGYGRTLSHIKDFEKVEKYNISFKTINLDFYFAFKEYLEDLDFALNTIGKFIKTIKIFMNYATEQGLNINLSYKSKLFIVPTENSEQIYLNEKELENIINLDLTDKPILNNARDLFIIGAYTGLRVSDFNILTKENIHIYKGQKMFKLRIKKTGQYLSIPIHYFIEKILLKYNGSTPKKMKHQDINDCLSIIGKLAGIDEIITTKITKGGKTKSKMMQKYKMIKNHCGRRSFCTNAYKSGMEITDIMNISGHKSFKTFKTYVKITEDDRAVKIAQSDFYKRDTLKIVN